MPLLDDINRVLRDFERYTGDGRPGAPSGAPLPTGDPSSGRRQIPLHDLRELLKTIAQTMGDEAALQDILAEVRDKAPLANSTKSFPSRAAAVSVGQAAIPASLVNIFTREGDELVLRLAARETDDPLFPSAPFWGVVARYPSGNIAATKIELGLVDLTAAELAADAARPDMEFYGDADLAGHSYITGSDGNTLAMIDGEGRIVPPSEGEFYGQDDWNAAFFDRDGNPILVLDRNNLPVPAGQFEFHDGADDWTAALAFSDGSPFLLLDKAGKPVLEVSGPGGSPLIGYVDGADLRAVGATDEVAAPLGSYNVLAHDGGTPTSVRAVIDRPGLGPSRVIAAGHGLLVPDQDKVLHVMIGLGQSLMVGSMSAASLVSTEQDWPDWVLMFGRGDGLSDVRMGLVTSDGSGAPALNPADLVGFEPLVARAGQGSGSRGETPMEALCRALQAEAQALNARHRMLAFTAAMGATAYSGLKKGTQTYANMLAALSRAKVLAEADGWKLIVDGCVVRHGEGDATSNSYDAYLSEWQADVDADVKAITGQQATVQFIVAQPSSFFDAGNAARRMLVAHNTRPNIHLAGPDYPFADLYASDLLHMTGPGYCLSGEYLARAWRHVLWSSAGKPKLVQMLSAVRTGRSVVIDYEVPVPPLVIDRAAVSERDLAGFQYHDSAGRVIVFDAVVTGPTQITLTLASTPSGTGEEVRYAAEGHSGSRTAATIARGNVRDSAADRSAYDNRRLANWGVHQIIPVTIS